MHYYYYYYEYLISYIRKKKKNLYLMKIFLHYNKTFHYKSMLLSFQNISTNKEICMIYYYCIAGREESIN